MNRYTVGMATQGLANYLKKQFPDEKEIKVAVAFDSRNNSSYFAQVTAEVLSANNIKVFIFGEIHPTPLLSFAVRLLNCNSGIVITASHNPKEYNGYKVYWNDGGQLINPHDKNVIAEVNKITGIEQVKFVGNKNLIETIGSSVDEEYLKQLKTLSLFRTTDSPQLSTIKIVYTPLHGSGVNIVPMAMKAFGFENVHTVAEQSVPDGNFPTLRSPNPEESSALELAIRDAKNIDADLVLATDPDADRVGIAVKSGTQGEYILLNGNQTASVLIYYLLKKWKENNKLTGREYIVKTIVTSELLKTIADKYNVECFDVLTGFKYIADIIKRLESSKCFIGGGEESYGYLVGDFVRDKDAVISCCMIAEAAVYALTQGKSFFELLKEIYVEFGFYREHLISLEKKGISGLEEIKRLMISYRNKPPVAINKSRVVLIKDYLSSVEKDLVAKSEKPIKLPKSDVLQFFLEDGTKISVRPSGTEPKIKYYFGVKGRLDDISEFDKVNKSLDSRIQSIIDDMNLK
jgi:phosphoglucomutase